MLRIAYNTGEYPRATDTFIQREVAALRELGAEVVTCSIRPTAREHHVGPEQVAEAAATFYVQPAAKSPVRLLSAHARQCLQAPGRYLRALRLAIALGWPGVKGRLWSLAYFLEAAVLADELRRRRITHLHNHFGNSSCSVAAIASVMGGLSLSFTEHGPATFFEPARWRLDLKTRLARFVACISDYCRSQVMMFSHPDDWAKLHIVHCGVDPELFTLRRHVDPPRQVLYVGRLAAVKGLPVLLDAWANVARRLPDVKLKLVGDGPDRRMLQARVDQAGLADRVAFTGYQSQAQVRQHLAESDLFVMSSFAEGVPVVLMEALAAGVPVVATRIAGVGELVEDGRCGRLVPPGNVAALAEALLALLSDASVRQRFGEAGRQRVIESYDVRREAAKLYRLFSEAVGQAPVKAGVSMQTAAGGVA